MNKHLLPTVLVALAFCAAAAPAFAGESVDGDGYAVDLPPGFKEVEALRGEGGSQIRSRFGTMPIDGAPDVRVYLSGSPSAPTATLLVSRVDLTTPIHTAEDLGLRSVKAMEARVPDGFEYSQRRIGKYAAIEMQFSTEINNEAHTSRVLSVACGDYIIVAMLHTADARYRGADETWDDIVGTLRVTHRSRDLIVYGLIGLGVLLALTFLIRIGRRNRQGLSTWETRFDSSTAAARSRSSSVTFAADGRTPARVPTSASVTRPPRTGAPSRAGLRTTLPDPSGSRSDGSR